MTAVDLQAELERWINFNASSNEPVDFFDVIHDLSQQGITGLQVRQELKNMGYVIDDYGTLQKRLP